MVKILSLKVSLAFFIFTLPPIFRLSSRDFYMGYAAAAAAATAAKSLQSFPTLCYPRDSSPLGSPVPGILQARTLE